jgi:putative antitoxin of VapBC-like toxin-antitoxin system
MLTHMKTTVEIADALLAEARKVAANDGTTVRALIEDGLRRTLAARRSKAPFKIRLVTFRGDGLHPQAGEGAWERIRELIYEGRGA